MRNDSLSNVDLILFFTGGMSLQTWDRLGMLDREVALYKALRPHLKSITFVTYGDSSELDYEDRIGDIDVVCNRWRLPQRLYVQLLKNVYPRRWKGSVIFKSNQVNGAQVALGAARTSHGKFIARCGYLFSENTEREFGEDSREAKRARSIESEVFDSANQLVVTTSAIRESISERYGVASERVSVIPNYVDTDVFRPGRVDDYSPKRIVFVGRMEKPKNLISLARSVKGLDVELLMVGVGAMESELRRLAKDEALPVRFLGKVQNNVLPEILRGAALFVLPSHYEGHPKALLEAMACGRPVIGADVPGIREVIQHDVTGYLCGTGPADIRKAIETLLNDDVLRERLGRNALKYIAENCSLERIEKLELQALDQLARE